MHDLFVSRSKQDSIDLVFVFVVDNRNERTRCRQVFCKSHTQKKGTRMMVFL